MRLLFAPSFSLRARNRLPKRPGFDRIDAANLSTPRPAMTATPPSPGVSRRLPAWLRAVLIAVALLVVVALIAPYFLDVDHYRALVSAAVKKQTGRELTIGKIRAKFLPTVGFVVSDAHLGNPPGFPQGDFLSVETLRGSLAWGPLLHKEIQINAIELVKPQARGQSVERRREVRSRSEELGRLC